MGGQGSGDFGHAGRKGEVGGSAKQDAKAAYESSKRSFEVSNDAVLSGKTADHKKAIIIEWLRVST